MELKLKDIAYKIEGGMFNLNIKRKDNLMHDSIEVWDLNFDEMLKTYGDLNVSSINTDNEGFITIFLEE